MAFAAYVSKQPERFRVYRFAVIGAPLELVFAQVNEPKKWEAWSPWAKTDPGAKLTFEGSPAGVGAKFFWSANGAAGEGRMSITESRQNELVRLEMAIFKPFKATNLTEFAMRAEGSQTVLTWTMTGTNGFLAKARGLFVNMDKRIGGQLDLGLAQLKALTETAPKE